MTNFSVVILVAFGTFDLVVRVSVNEASCIEQLDKLRVRAALLVLAVVIKGENFAVVHDLDPEAFLRFALVRRVKLQHE